MIKIVTGKINQLKTTRLIKHYQENLLGDGYASIKYMNQQKVDHYELFRLSTKESIPFIIREENVGIGKESFYRYSRWWRY